jgi:hypothetical protein
MREHQTLKDINTEKRLKKSKEKHHLSTPISVPRISTPNDNIDTIDLVPNNTTVTNSTTCGSNHLENTMRKQPSTCMKIKRSIRLRRVFGTTRISYSWLELLAGGGWVNPVKRKPTAARTPSDTVVLTTGVLKNLLDTCTYTVYRGHPSLTGKLVVTQPERQYND